MAFVSLLRKYDRQLKKYYKEQLKTSNKSITAVWVCDNYRLCSLPLKAAIGSASSEDDKDLMPLFFLCKECFEKGEEISEERIIAAFAHKKLSMGQAQILPVLLAAAACAVLCEHLCEKDSNVAVMCIKNLIKLRETDTDRILFDTSEAERLLCDDPAGVYPFMDTRSKHVYRKAVIKKAEKEGLSETEVIRKALRNAASDNNGKNHIGFYLPVCRKSHVAGTVFIFAEWFAAVTVSVMIGLFVVREIYAPFLLLLPVYAILKPLWDILSSVIFPPFCPVSISEDAVTSGDTLITISSLLPSASAISGLEEHLSEVYSSNSLDNVKVMLLADMRNSSFPEEASDETDIAAVKRVIDSLNEKHNGGFCFAVRDRVFSPFENEYTGFERKRGALSDLAKYLRDGNSNAFNEVYGDIQGLTDMKYIMALDSDTQMSFETLRKLVAVAMHPLNRPVSDRLRKRIISGYGIISPRVETSLESAEKTVFSRIFTNGGSISYSPFVHERYMDMFGKSIFCGKGLIDIDAFSLVCGEKFDRNRILSHDILEGNVLRTAFAGHCELTDNFPKNPEGYFLRLHRWIRGDIQNLKYIFYPLGSTETSPSVTLLGKYQLADNARRAFTPIICLLLLFLACFSQYYTDSRIYLLAGLFGVAAEFIVPVIVSFLKSGFRAFTSLYFSSEISSFYKNIFRLVLSVASLPDLAFRSLDAIIRSSWRSLVSGKKLLQWQTAADTDSLSGNNFLFSAALPIITAIVFFFTGSSLHRLVAVLICGFIPFSFYDGIRIKHDRQLHFTENERKIISSFAAAAWRFFDENVTMYENWLPPDNIQETPVPRKAMRTSPTNIGFYLVSILAVYDLGIISLKECTKRIGDTLTSVESLPKYHGLLFNWYDTVKMKPLKPAYVSAVDCGNFCVCLTALKEGLREYKNDSVAILSIIDRIEKILGNSDMTVLYDSKRELFRIGLDCETGEMSGSFYDLYMSEARMTSFYECARRHIPSSHWQKLDRGLKRNGSYMAAASWTGTMFEYFMPALFLENVPDSFQYEALKTCLYTQRKFAKKRNIPYGISESCFYAVDNLLNYKYKAHGIKKLALKREADEESVVSPYSVFLTLPFDKDIAMKNLAELSALHCEGRCGFYEAVDFTADRTDGEHYAIVRNYMSHHVGMSIVAVANTLLGNVFVRRFMADNDMKSAKNLLREKIPVHQEITNGLTGRTAYSAQKRITPKRERNAPGEGESSYAYSNGEVTVFCDKYGRNRCVFSTNEIYGYSERSRGISVGIKRNDNISVVFPCDEKQCSLKKYALYRKFDEDDISVSSAITVHPSENAVLVPVSIANSGDKAVVVDVLYYLEPSLLHFGKEDPHPVFSDMFLKTDYDEKNKSVTFYRYNSESSVCVSIGFCSKNRFVCSLDREKVLTTKGVRKSVFEKGYDTRQHGSRGINPVAAVSTQITVAPGKKTECVLAICVGGSITSAEHCLMKVRSRALPAVTSGAAATFLRDRLTFEHVCAYISRVYFDGTDSEIIESAKKAVNTGVSALWKVGISGDRPIITVFPDRDCPPLLQRSYIRLFRRLAKCSVPADMVFIFRDNKEYDFSGEKELIKIIEEEGVSDSLNGKGLFIFYESALEKDSFAAIIAFSGLIYPDIDNSVDVRKEYIPAVTNCMPVSCEENHFIHGGYVINKHPFLPWCHTVSNDTFGMLVTDSSPGYTWALNSRQNKLSTWSNDTSVSLNGERIIIDVDGVKYDPCADASVEFSVSSAVFRSKTEDLQFTVIAEVADKGMCKRIRIFADNTGIREHNLAVSYIVAPVLGEARSTGRFLDISVIDKGVSVKNVINEDYTGVMLLSSDNENSEYFNGIPDEEGYENRYASVLQKFVLLPGDSLSGTVYMSFGKDVYTAKKVAEKLFSPKKTPEVNINTGFADFDEFSKSLLYHQVSDTRLRARCGFYQCSGAFGFRDQLQDVLALIGRENRKVRQIIFSAASAQFEKGDVLHWFHRCYKGRLLYKGVRTKCSDDKLWLPFVVAEYVLKTGDTEILHKKIPFLEGASLSSEMSENYGEYFHGDNRVSLYRHCIYAITDSLKTGVHSLPLMGNGDWNDSFDLVGKQGKGESVWLAMFIRTVCLKFAKICDMMQDIKMLERMSDTAEYFASAADRYGWNGKWYLRGFYDDGSALGEEGNTACETDLLCQAWASLSDMPDKHRVQTALLSAYVRLFDREKGIVRLFYPPFSSDDKMTGYVNFYPEGMRENGGQYTHAAVWFVMALFKEGLKDQGEEVLKALLPSEKYRDGMGDKYMTEPYYMAGDVYDAKGFEGRGGWSLYTGSAGWMMILADMLSQDNNG